MNVVNLDNKNITNYIDARTNYDDGTTNKFQALVNAEDLFSGNVDLGDVNKFQALVNKFQALVNTEDAARPYINYAKLFTIVDAEDAPPPDGSDNQRAISNIFSLNMITGLDVTIGTDVHNIYPGAFLNSMAANFNITYAKGNLTVLHKALKVGTNNLTIPYGKILTNADLNTNFDGWAFEGVYQESVVTVFPNGIPYYFVKVGGDSTELDINELKELGDYTIKIRDAKNYKITYDNASLNTLTIEAINLTFNPVALEINYGQTPPIDPQFTGFVYNDDVSTVFPDGIPYYFINSTNIEFEMDAIKEIGHYDIRIRNTNNNYIFDFDDSSYNSFDVTKKDLNAVIDNLYIKEGDTPHFTSTMVGFVNNENVESVFPNGIPYYFVDQNGIEQTEIETGAYTIKIRDPKNYTIVYDSDANLFVNPSRHHAKKVKVYTECVTYNSTATNGLMYTVTYRYKNKNHDTIYVAKGVNNNLLGAGAGTSIGDLPTVFMPGSHTFTIQFNGEKLVWKLTTYGSSHKSSVSTHASSSSRKCKEESDDDDDDHSDNDDNHSDSQKIKVIIYPNPIEDEVRVGLNEKGEGTVEIYNDKDQRIFKKEVKDLKKGAEYNMQGKKSGNYHVRVKYKGKTYTATLLKYK